MNKIIPSNLNNPLSLTHASSWGELLVGVIKISEAKIDSKIFHSWKMAGLLPTVQAGKMAKLSFIDLLWVETLNTMRKFGCSRGIMHAICKKLFYDAYEVNLGKVTLEKNHAILTNLASKRPLTYEEDQYLNSLSQTLNDSIYMSVLDRGINYFYHLVINSLSNNIEVGLIIYQDGNFSTYELKNQQDMSRSIDLSVPHILIPISSFIKEFIVQDEKEQFLNQFGLLNEQEFEVIKLIRKKNIKSITVYLNEKIVQKIETTESGLINDSDVKFLKQKLGLKNYDSIEINSRDNSKMSFTKKTKIFMNK